jgi:hypothetical protein
MTVVSAETLHLEHKRLGLRAGWEFAFRLPVTAAQFIIKSSLFVQLLGVVRLLEPKLAGILFL